MEPNHFITGNIVYFFITPFIHLLYSLFDKVNFIHRRIVEHIIKSIRKNDNRKDHKRIYVRFKMMI